MFDPYVLPARVQERLMLAGYWQCPAELRDKLDRWPELHEDEAAVADRQVGLVATALAR